MCHVFLPLVSIFGLFSVLVKCDYQLIMFSCVLVLIYDYPLYLSCLFNLISSGLLVTPQCSSMGRLQTWSKADLRPRQFYAPVVPDASSRGRIIYGKIDPFTVYVTEVRSAHVGVRTFIPSHCVNHRISLKTKLRAVTMADFYHRGGNGPTTTGGRCCDIYIYI